MATQSRNLVARIDGDVSGFTKAVKNAEQSAKVFERELKKLEQRQTQSVAHVSQMRSRYEAQAARQEAESARAMERAAAKRTQAMDQVGKAGVAMGAAMAAGVALSVRAAADWESAWAGVAKTVDGNAKQMAVLEGELRQLARTLPASHREIAAVAEAAGQLGIKREAIAGFTKVMVDLGETTNLTADQAATAMAQIANIMGTAPEDIDRMGAALVALGNNGASTEADIVEMALRIAGAGKQLNLAESDVFAMANALASVGINAEAGGSAISRFMMNIGVAVETGNASVKGFADVAGMSVEQFSTLFREDAVGAVGAFTDGLGRIQESGGSAIVTLENMEITEIRMRDALLRLAGAQGLLSASVDLGRESWEANNALVEEANKRYATTEAKAQVAKNAVNDLAINVGSTLLPALAKAADGLANMAGFLADLPEPAQGAIAAVGILGATVGILGGGALIAIPKIAAFKAAVAALGWEGDVAAKRMGRLSTVMKGGLIAGAAAGVTTAIFALIDSFAEAGPKVSALAEDLLRFGQDGRITGDMLHVLGEDFANVAEQVRVANSSKWWSFTEGRNEVQEARNDLQSLDQALASLVANGQGELAADIFGRMTRAVEEQGGKVSELRESLTGYGDAQAEAAATTSMGTIAAQAMADAVGGIDDTLTNAYSSLGAWAEAQGMSEEATKDLTKQIEQWAQSLADFVQPLGAYTDLLKEKESAERETAEKTAAATESQKDSWEDYADAVSVSVGEYLARLREQVEAQEQWHNNMTTLAGRVSQTTLDELARMGPEGAPLVAELVNASAEELVELEDLFGRRTKGATGAMASELFLAQPLLAQIGAKLGQGVVESLTAQLAAGTTSVAQIANDYAGVLGDGINPLLTALGKASIARRDAAQTRRPRGFWGGGEVAGPGGPTDDLIPAWLSNGEHVWTAREVANAGGHEAVEQMRDQFRYAAGGPVLRRPPSTSPFRPPVSTAADATMAHGYAEALAFIERHSLAGSSDLVSLGRKLQAMGFRVSGHAAFGGTPRSGHAPNSKHYRNRAIDVNFGPGGQSAVEMAAIDALMPKLAGIPFSEKLWRTKGHFDHLHLGMAKGGAVGRRSPLAPRPTKLGAPRFATGGPVWSGPTTGGSGSLSQVAAGLGSADALRALLEGWDRHLEQLKQAERRHELLVAVQKREAGALEALREFDVAAYRDAEREAVEAQIDALEALATAEEDAARAAQEDYERRVDINNAKYELGELTTEQHLGNLDRRLAKEERYSAKWMDLHRQREAVLKDVADAERRAADEAERALKDRQDAVADALSNLNRLLDQQAAVQGRIAQSSQRFAEQQASLDARRRDEAGRFAAQQQALQRREQDAATQHFARLADAHADFAATEQQLLGQRRDQLANFTAADQLTDFRRGLPAGWLVGNVRRQVDDLRDWMQQLDLAREMGVSEAVITALGLDEGPQALYQVKALTSATAAEVDALNDAVEARTRVAGEQTRHEQAHNLGQLGQALTAAQQQYAAAVAGIQADYRKSQEQLAADLLALQAEHRQSQQALADELRTLQQEFLAEQAELSAELAAIGQEQGRSYGAAIAEGMRSQVEAVRQAARELAAAQQALATAQKPVAAAPTPVTSAPKTPTTSGGWGTAGQVAALRRAVGLPIDPVSDRVWVDRIQAGEATFADVRGRLLDKVRSGTYDSGGWLMPGLTLAYNGTGQPERVLTAQQALPAVAPTQRTVTFNNQFTIADPVDHELVLRQQAFQANAGGM